MVSKHWADGSQGSQALANRVAEIADTAETEFTLTYNDEMSLAEKIQNVCKKIYRADEAVMDKKILDQLRDWENQGYGNLPVCMAKTQYSFSTDPNLRGAPLGHVCAGKRG